MLQGTLVDALAVVRAMARLAVWSTLASKIVGKEDPLTDRRFLIRGMIQFQKLNKVSRRALGRVELNDGDKHPELLMKIH